MGNKQKKTVDYKILWKNQKNRNSRLNRKIHNILKAEGKRLEKIIRNEKIEELERENQELKSTIVRLSMEAQRYFDLLMRREVRENESTKDNT